MRENDTKGIMLQTTDDIRYYIACIEGPEDTPYYKGRF